MLLDPIALPDSPDTAVLPPVDDTPQELPAELAALVTRARRDRGSALALVHLLLERGWSVPVVRTSLGDLVGLSGTQIEALAAVRRPRTSASDVADRLVASRLQVPHPRSG